MSFIILDRITEKLLSSRATCNECSGRLNLLRWATCKWAFVCRDCAHRYGYTAYQPSLR